MELDQLSSSPTSLLPMLERRVLGYVIMSKSFWLVSTGTNVQTLETLEDDCRILSDLWIIIGSSFASSSRKDRLVEADYECLNECLWSSCFRVIPRPENEVSVTFP